MIELIDQIFSSGLPWGIEEAEYPIEDILNSIIHLDEICKRETLDEQIKSRITYLIDKLNMLGETFYDIQKVYKELKNYIKDKN